MAAKMKKLPGETGEFLFTDLLYKINQLPQTLLKRPGLKVWTFDKK